MEQAYLKSRLLYAPRRGVFYWVTPPAEHPELLGEEAGSRRMSRGKAYCIVQIDGEKYTRAKLAFLYMTGEWPAEVVDHINGNSLDDRWENLRAATIMQNAWNHKGRAKSSDLPMGVRLNKSGRYAARIGVAGRQISLGTFDTQQEAEAAYRIARSKYFGHFA